MLSIFTNWGIGGTAQDPISYLKEEWEYAQCQSYELDEDEVNEN